MEANDIKTGKLPPHVRGLVSIRDTTQDETVKINESIRNTASRDKLLTAYLRQKKSNGQEQLEPSREDMMDLRGTWHVPTRN